MSPKSAKRVDASATEGFSDDEQAAMKERARELRAQARADKADGESAVLTKIAEMQIGRAHV